MVDKLVRRLDKLSPAGERSMIEITLGGAKSPQESTPDEVGGGR